MWDRPRWIAMSPWAFVRSSDLHRSAGPSSRAPASYTFLPKAHIRSSAAKGTVESRKGAVPESYCMPTRFPSPLIKPDVPVSSIRLSDRLHQLAHGSGPDAHRGAVAPPTSRTQSRSRNWWRPATTPYGGASGNSSLARGRSDRPLDTPSTGSRNQSNSTTLARHDSGDRARRSTVPRSGAPANLPLSAAAGRRSFSTDSLPNTHDHPSEDDAARTCNPENQNALSVPAWCWSSLRSA